jgi:uncharacterized repeat protein (TIGR01451 family)
MMKISSQILRMSSILGAVCLAISLFFWSQIAVAQAAELPNASISRLTQAPQTITGTITTIPAQTILANQLLTYTIRFSSDNNIPLLTVSNNIPNQTTYLPNSIQAKAIAPTSISSGTLGSKILIWNVSNLRANDEVELSFVTIPIANNVIITNLVRFSASADELSHTIAVGGNPQVALTQTSSVTEALIGDTIVYSYQIQNIGDIPLNNLVLSDDLIGAITTVANLAPNQGIELRTYYEVKTSDETTQRVVNRAMVMNGLVTATAKSVVTITGGNLNFEVANLVTPTVVTKVGQVITYTYHVTNTGNVTLKNAVLTNKMGPIQPIIDLSPNQSITRVQLHTVTTQDMMSPNSSIVNEVTLVGFDIFNHNLNRIAASKVMIDFTTPTPTATSTVTPIVTSTPPTPTPTLPATATTPTSTATPKLTATPTSSTPVNYLPIVIKQPAPTPTLTPTPTNTPNPKIVVEINANKTEANLGQEVLYQYTVRNAGNVPLSQVKVIDSRLGDILTLATLNAQEIKTTTRSYTVGLKDLNSLKNQVQATGQFREQSVTNTATINVTIPTTHLSLAGANTGKLTLEIYLQTTGELVHTCITANNQTSACGDIHANIVYKIKVVAERCGTSEATKSYPVGPFTQKVSC